MELIKRHYEKIILLALSLVSIFAVWRMTQIVETTKEVKDSDLEIRIPPPDQESLTEKLARYRKATEEKNAEAIAALNEDSDFADFLKTKMFRADYFIDANKISWEPFGFRDARWKNYFSDLLQIFNMAKCPECECGIPIYCFRNSHKCVICGVTLDTPPAKIRKRRRRTPEDLDGDGIPNDREKGFAMDENYAGDALLDADGDGFSNRFEIMVSNTDPRNPTSCPPLWRRLRFRGMSKVKLPIELTSVNVGKSNDPKTWTVSIESSERDLRTGRLKRQETECRIGETLKFEGRTYEVTNIETLMEKDTGGMERKRYAVTLKMVSGDEKYKSQLHELRLVFGQPVYSPDLRVVLEDIGCPEDADGKRYYARRGEKRDEAIYILRPGEAFEIGGTSDRGPGRNVIREFYKLESFDERNMVANLSRLQVRAGEDPTKDREGVPMIVTRNSDIEEDDWVTIPTDKPTGDSSQSGAPSRRRRTRE